MFVGSSAESAIERIVDDQDTLAISKPIIEETPRILAEEFERNAEQLSRTAVFMSDISTTVVPTERLTVLSDDPDNRILECAIEGGADKIVTDDKAMLNLGIHEGLEIVSLRSYLSNY